MQLNGSAERFTVLPYRESRARPSWPPERPPIRVVFHSSRTVRGPVEQQLGVCDTLIFGADAQLSALSTSVLLDLPLLMQPHPKIYSQSLMLCVV